MTPDEEAAYRARQRSRAVATAVVLGLLVLLFFAVTIAKQS